MTHDELEEARELSDKCPFEPGQQVVWKNTGEQCQVLSVNVDIESMLVSVWVTFPDNGEDVDVAPDELEAVTTA